MIFLNINVSASNCNIDLKKNHNVVVSDNDINLNKITIPQSVITILLMCMLTW